MRGSSVGVPFRDPKIQTLDLGMGFSLESFPEDMYS